VGFNAVMGLRETRHGVKHDARRHGMWRNPTPITSLLPRKGMPFATSRIKVSCEVLLFRKIPIDDRNATAPCGPIRVDHHNHLQDGALDRLGRLGGNTCNRNTDRAATRITGAGEPPTGAGLGDYIMVHTVGIRALCNPAEWLGFLHLLYLNNYSFMRVSDFPWPRWGVP